MSRFISEIFLNSKLNLISEAEYWAKKAIETDEGNGLRWWHMARDYAHYAEVLKRKGDLSGAKETLKKALELYKECAADGWVEKYEKKLASFP